MAERKLEIILIDGAVSFKSTLSAEDWALVRSLTDLLSTAQPLPPSPPTPKSESSPASATPPAERKPICRLQGGKRVYTQEFKAECVALLAKMPVKEALADLLRRHPEAHVPGYATLYGWGPKGSNYRPPAAPPAEEAADLSSCPEWLSLMSICERAGLAMDEVWDRCQAEDWKMDDRGYPRDKRQWLFEVSGLPADIKDGLC